MFKAKPISIALMLIGLGIAPGAALASGSSVINSDFVNLGSGLGVAARCGGTWDNATASLKVKQVGAGSQVEIELEGGRPNTLYTIWLRLQGTVTATGASFGGSPMTGEPVTALAPGSAIPELIEYTAPNPGSPMAVNGFTTDANGNGEFMTALDFPLVGGAYPFNLAPAFNAVAGFPPVAIVNPGAGVSGPFLLRIATHCSDGLAHGLNPGVIESWFDWPN
jgi:hypothetical protein